MDRTIKLRETLILTAAGVLGILAVIPYTLTLQPPPDSLEMPLSALLLIQVIQNTVLLTIAVVLGLELAHRCGLGAPVLEAWLGNKPVTRRLKAVLAPAFLLGAILSIVILVLEKALFEPQLPSAFMRVAGAPWWQSLLASFYGGITEELLMRLGIFSLITWLLTKINRRQTSQSGNRIFWIANVFVAILFGLGHLPATAALVTLTPMIIVRASLLNGIASLVFGHLYWTRGLESAMIAHFTGDIILHVLAPLF